MRNAAAVGWVSVPVRGLLGVVPDPIHPVDLGHPESRAFVCPSILKRYGLPGCPALEMNTRRNYAAMLSNNASTPVSSTCASVNPSTPRAPPLERTSNDGSQSLAPSQGLRRSASTDRISPTAGSRATRDPGVSPDRTSTGRPTRTYPSVTPLQPPSTSDTRATGRFFLGVPRAG